jgi:hypothetical protein
VGSGFHCPAWSNKRAAAKDMGAPVHSTE